MTRNGKIARLPRTVRDELNRRLLDSEQGIRLVKWLNDREDVQAVLKADFGGRPINEQNLTEWRQGGFEEWRKHQEALELAGQILEEAEDYEDLADGSLLSDRLAEMAAVSLAKLMRTTVRLEDGPEKRQATLEIVRELVRLRRTDRDWERAQREEDIHERESDAYWEEKKREIDSTVQGSIGMYKFYREQVRQAKAAHEAKGEPVPAHLVELGDNLDRSYQEWTDRRKKMATASRLETQRDQTKSK